MIDEDDQISGEQAYHECIQDGSIRPRRLDRDTADAEERAKLTPKLRFRILERDKFRCRACGGTPETGAHLHIDHIVPISRGGPTIDWNLRVLCSLCNIGKAAAISRHEAERAI